MSRLTIEHDIPVPSDPDDFRYPWPQMKPGDSVTVRGIDRRNAARSSFYQYNKRRMRKGGNPLFLKTKTVGPNLFRLWVLDVPNQDNN